MENKQTFDRTTGVRLAKEAGAVKTAAIIEDEKSCFQEIFETAITEIGQDRFVSTLNKGPKIWSKIAANVLPNFAGKSNIALASLDTTVAKAGDSIAKFRLLQGAPVSGIVKINNLPPDKRFLNKNDTYEFNPVEWNIAEGGSVTLWFGIEDDALIGLAAAPESFKFDSTSSKVAYYHSWGPAGTQKFALLDHAV